MNAVLFLILFPLIAAGAILCLPPGLRDALVKLAALAVGVASIALLAAPYCAGASFYSLESRLIDHAVAAGEILLGLCLLFVGLKFRKPAVAVLALAQAVLAQMAERAPSLQAVSHPLFIDSLSIVMALIIGIIGGIICVHATGYMRDYHRHHAELGDSRRGFFAVFFVFLSSMFGLVFSNSLAWIFFCWEITTLCSFVLIAYPRTDEAIRNAFHALTMNLLGGLGLALAIFYQARTGGSMELDGLLRGGPALVLVPAALICFAGIAKSAQYPFSSWLLGAMVAPTPVSALLHSSTMVNAGVYVIIRLAPVLQHTLVGFTVALVGAVTFLMASMIAVSQSNAKRVLAYSTVANLGLIVTCAGVGSPQAVWAAILLLIFHAVAKALLFLTVGTVEHRIDSRDIEDMHGLITRLPRPAMFLLVGMAGMFLAPFGMLISKWAALEALIAVNPLLPILVCFGSAPTLFFWSKWMGKVLAAAPAEDGGENLISGEEMISLYALSSLTVALCALFPVVSHALIDPYLLAIYGTSSAMSRGTLIIMALMLSLVLLLPLSLLYRGGRRNRLVRPYLGGANADLQLGFLDSTGAPRAAVMKNYYLEQFFGENQLGWIGVASCTCFIAAMFVVVSL